MDSGLITIFLPLALAVVMAGLGLELTPNDFKRVSKHPKAVFIALFCQLVVLTAIAFFICKLLNLPPFSILCRMGNKSAYSLPKYCRCF